LWKIVFHLGQGTHSLHQSPVSTLSFLPLRLIKRHPSAHLHSLAPYAHPARSCGAGDRCAPGASVAQGRASPPSLS
jgi:hypothetical protein